MAAGPDMGSAGPRTCIQPDTNSRQSQPFRALATLLPGRRRPAELSWWLTRYQPLPVSHLPDDI